MGFTTAMMATGTSSSPTQMNTNTIHFEFRRFTLKSLQLRSLYLETLKALDEIASNPLIARDSVKNLEWKVKEVHRQRCSLGRPPCVVVLGQNCRVKAILVNELFGQTHLPVLETPESLTWRMVRFKYGRKSQVLLTLGTSYELVENLHDGHWKSFNTTIRQVDLTVPDEETKGSVDDCAVVEMHLNHSILLDNAQLVVPPTGNRENFAHIIRNLFETTTPIVIYGISSSTLSNEDVHHLQMLRSLNPTLPIFFVHMPFSEETSGLTEVDRNEVMTHGGLSFTTESEQDRRTSSTNSSGHPNFNSPVVSQLVNLGLLWETSGNPTASSASAGQLYTLEKAGCWLTPENMVKSFNVTSDYINCLDQLPRLSTFIRCYLLSQLIAAANHLHRVHSSCLQMFILSAFEMAREMQITPKRLDYARMKENELYESLMKVAEKKQDEMCILIGQIIAERKEDILQKSESYQFKDPFIKNWEGPVSGKLVSQCIEEIRELVVLDLNNIIAQKLISSVYCLHNTFIGTLERCIDSLEKNVHDFEEGESMASAALKQILTAAYQVEVPNHHSSSLLRGLYDKMKQLLHALPWSSVPSVDGGWRRSVAADMLDSLCQSRLAKAVCCQLRERLKTSHESFASALRHLESHHIERLEKTEEQGYRLRKVYAPRLARLALETSSITDCLLYEMPQCGKEIGRGQYGVVYACESWAGFAPCAIKSVVPMDDKHWNDLAMEFYYMRSIPENDRIVRVRGSVIDYSYAGGSIPAVLIVMDRLSRDLYCALKLGLSWLDRLQVALDVVSGIRYLHSQGLVHRDIKLKNILLDSCNRAKLTDLGFCKPEAMMSGSIVGTPIHMAPELFSGQYDNSVDVYAFGILFWYLCAGKVKLPQTFDKCQNKEHLWNSVRKGSRPERLSYFDEECWRLMEKCWSGDASARPLLGVVQPTLQSIKDRFEKLHVMSQDFTISERSLAECNGGATTAYPLVIEVTSEFVDTSPYLNVEFDAVT